MCGVIGGVFRLGNYDCVNDMVLSFKLHIAAESDIARSPYFKIESSMRLRPGCFAVYNVKAIAPSIPMSTLHTFRACFFTRISNKNLV